MPAIGDPPPAIIVESRSAHGAPAPVSYVPVPCQLAACSGPRRRPGARRPEETRNGDLRTGVVANAPGSAYMQQGRTKIIATVYGPRPVVDRGQTSAEGSLLLDFSFAPFASRYESREGNEKRTLLYGSVLQRALESIVNLERYAKLALDVSVHVLEDDGSVLTAALAAASLALADAKVEMRDLAAGASVHMVPGAAANGGPLLLLDCEGEEERSLPEGCAVLHLGLCPAQGTVCLLHSGGPIPAEPFEQMVLLAKETAEKIGAEMRRGVEERELRRSAKRARKAQRAEGRRISSGDGAALGEAEDGGIEGAAAEQESPALGDAFA